FPHTCDSIQRLSDIWRMNTDHGFFADVVLPVKLTTPSARQYMIEVMARFKGDIERHFGRPITDDDLGRSISLYNRIRSLLKEIYEMRSKAPSIFPGSELCSLMKASVTVDRNILPEALEGLVSELRAKAPSPGSNVKRLMLVGSVCDHPDIHSIIERSGGSVVWDDLCTGTRHLGAIEEGKDPLIAIADRYFERPICPAKHKSPTARGDHITAQAKEHGVEGVIFLYLKFCDPHSFDYPCIKESLEKAHVPSMLLEIEDRLPPEGQLLTRLETFIQML
ncbi:MAG TPA: 2-hydroxyacyl-CoA dehydratase family protein, partial [Deltaproteobacteria bacterium]|nr:2-hydroxyacyl-CoA dehydratase family protein [Deltaproteobacteria bacterium]